MAALHDLGGTANYMLLLSGILVAYGLYKLFAYPIYRWKLTRSAKANDCLPAPKLTSRDPLLGLDTLSMIKTAIKEHHFLENAMDIFQRTGSWTVELNLFGHVDIRTAHPENIKAILATNAKDWEIGHSRKKSFIPVFGPNIVTSDGEYWHESRTLFRPTFARKQLGNLEEAMETHFLQFRDMIPNDGRAFDLKPLFYMYSMDISTEFLFGASTNTLSTAGNDDGRQFSEAFDFMMRNVQTVQKLGILQRLFPNKEVQKHQRILDDNLDSLMKRAIGTYSSESKTTKYNVLHEMVRAWTGQDKRIRSESFILLMAGRDTSAAAMTTLFWHLSRQPSVWAKIREEALNGPEKPSYDDLRNLKYLHNCAREGLRIVNPTIDLTRTAATDTILPKGGGPDGESPLFVSKGTDFSLWIYAVHHRKDIWGPDADDFKPERWDSFNASMSWAYNPFGGGARICLGQQLAMTEILYTTYKLAREFKRCESVDTMPFQEDGAIAITNEHGAQVRLIRS